MLRPQSAHQEGRMDRKMEIKSALYTSQSPVCAERRVCVRTKPGVKAAQIRGAQRPASARPAATKTTDVTSSGGGKWPKSVDAWFRKILKMQKMSTIDLADAFCFGNASKHRYVQLNHFCDVLFKLNPGGINGHNPLTDGMEEFLYYFTTEQTDGLVVDVQKAVKALDVWDPKPERPRSCSCCFPSEGCVRIQSPHSLRSLVDEKDKLRKEIFALKLQNLRLSREIQGQKDRAESSDESYALDSPEFTSSPVRNVTPTEIDTPGRHSCIRNSAVNGHEVQLVDIATKLQYDGVRRLESSLYEADTSQSGFLTAKEICWAMKELHINISQSDLIELCLGLKFDAHARIDYIEFIDLLLDILVYEKFPDKAQAKHAEWQSLARELREYLSFLQSDSTVTSVHSKLYEVYRMIFSDEELLPMSRTVAFFMTELKHLHPKLKKCPLSRSDLIKFLQPFAGKSHEMSTLSDQRVVDVSAMFDALCKDDGNDVVSRRAPLAFTKAFWTHIRNKLCSYDSDKIPLVSTQLEKIFHKLDRFKSRSISHKQWNKILDRHLNDEEMEVISKALESTRLRTSYHQARHERDWSPCKAHCQDGVRYDIFLCLVFEQDISPDNSIEQEIRFVLKREMQTHRESFLTSIAASSTNGLSLDDFYSAFHSFTTSLSSMELLYLSCKFGVEHATRIHPKVLYERLQTFLQARV